jgi:hypothetical protein
MMMPETDRSQEFRADRVFGRWFTEEAEWCQAAAADGEEIAEPGAAADRGDVPRVS